MASIQTAIQLTDGVTSTLHNIVNALNMTISTFEEVQRAGNLDIDSNSFSGIREEINGAAFAVQNLEQELNGLNVEQTGSLNIDSGNVSTVREGMESATLAVQNLNQEISNIGLNQVNSEIGLDVDTRSLSDARKEINETVSAVQNLDRELGSINVEPLQGLNSIEADIGSLEAVTGEINNAGSAAQNLGQELSSFNVGSVRIDIEPVWKSVDVPTFTNTGIERFQQEVQSANKMLNQLATSQKSIQSQSARTNLLPANAIVDLASLNNRIVALKDQLNSVEPIDDIGAENASDAVERLREQIDLALAVQEELNQALNNMDVSRANAAYQQLNETIGSAEKEYKKIPNVIDEAKSRQEALNNSISRGASAVSGLAVGFAMAVTNKAINAVTSSLDSAITRIDTLNNFPKVMQQLGYSADSASAATQRLSNGVQGLPTTLDSVVSTAQQITALTGNLEYATETTLALNNAFLASGASSDTATRGMQQYTQMLSSGIVDAQSWRTLQETMPYALNKVADAFGYAGSTAQNDLYTAIKDNEITVGELNQKFIELSNETGGFAEVAKTATGGIGTAFTNMKTAITKGSTEIISAFDSLLANTSFGSLEGLISSIGTAFRDTMTEISYYLSYGGDLLNNFIAMLSSVGGMFGTIWSSVSPILGVALGALSSIFGLVSSIAQFITNNWSLISPIIYGIVTAFLIYNGILVAHNIIQGISTALKTFAIIKSIAHGTAVTNEMVATTGLTTEQLKLNAAMYSCPVLWILVIIIAIIAAIYLVVAAINKLTGSSISATGIICGVIAVACAFIGNIFVALINFAIDLFVVLWNFIAAFANFFGNVFNDPVGSIARLFFDLVDSILNLLQSLAGAIDAIFGSNLAGSVQGWRDSLSGWVDETFGQGEEIMAKVDGSEWHVDRFDYGSAWDAGYDFGEGIDETLSNISISDLISDGGINPEDYMLDYEPVDLGGTSTGDGVGSSGLGSVGSNVGNIADDTEAIKGSVELSEEDLKYLRDIAERDVVNRFTTAELTVEFTSNNNINSDMDLDGVVSYLEDKVTEALESAAEGVHV